MTEEHDESNYRGLDEIKCPWCDYEVNKYGDDYDNHFEDEAIMHECYKCEKSFAATAVLRVTYDCVRVKPDITKASKS